MDFKQLQARLGRTGQVFVGGALLVFILSFLPWYSASYSYAGHSSSGHLAAWHAQFGAWFPVLLILALGVVSVLWAMGTIKWAPLFLWAVGTATAIVATVIILLRWMTYPSASGADGYGSASAGAGWALYVSLVVTAAMAVFGYLGFTGAGGDIKNLPAVFQGGGQGGAPFVAQPPAQPYYQGGPAQPYNQPPAGQGYDPNQGQQQYNPNQGQPQYDPNQGGGQPYQGGPYNQG